MDYKELIESLSGYFEGKALKRGDALKAAIAIETLLAEREDAGWISVNDTPVPNNDERYIVFTHYHGIGEVECRKGWAAGANVTHWMPLPKPPFRSKERGDTP